MKWKLTAANSQLLKNKNYRIRNKDRNRLNEGAPFFLGELNLKFQLCQLYIRATNLHFPSKIIITHLSPWNQVSTKEDMV